MKQRLSAYLIVLGLLVSPLVFAEKSLYIYTWNDFLSPDSVARFEKKTGIKVTTDVYDSNDVLEAKLFAGNTGYDIVFPSYFPYLIRQVKAGIYEPLDAARLPHLKGVDKRFDDPLTIEGKRYAVPFMWGTIGLAYNVDKIQALFGKDFKPDSWGFIFDPKNAEKLKSCGVALMNSPIYLGPIMMKYLGLDPTSIKAEDYAKAMKQFALIRPSVTYFHDSQYISDLATGNVCLAVGWSGDLIIARERAKLAAKPMNIAYINPKEGGPLFFDVMAVPKGAKNIDAAYQFMDFILEPQTMAELTEFNFYPSPVTASRALLPAALQNDTSIYPPQATMDQMFVQGELPLTVERQVNRDWARMKSGEYRP